MYILWSIWLNSGTRPFKVNKTRYWPIRECQQCGSKLAWPGPTQYCTFGHWLLPFFFQTEILANNLLLRVYCERTSSQIANRTGDTNAGAAFCHHCLPSFYKHKYPWPSQNQECPWRWGVVLDQDLEYHRVGPVIRLEDNQWVWTHFYDEWCKKNN